MMISSEAEVLRAAMEHGILAFHAHFWHAVEI